MATNQGFKSFIPNANLLSPDYLYWWLRKSRAYLNELGVGATFKEVSKSIVERIEIPLPPLAEQKRIAAILDKAAEIKAKREQAIAKLDELAMSTFMKMFGNQPDSVETTLGECLRLINGRAYLQHELLNEGTPIIRIQNLNGGNRWYYSNLKLPEEKYCDNGDLLFAWSATFGPYIWRGNKSIYHYHIWKIEPKELFDKTFAFYLLQSITREIKNASHGASMLHMTKSGMEAWPIKLPPLKAQMRFVEFANRLQSIREAMEESKGIIFDKEKSLQHQAFTVGFNA
jgi:type I restriction enzyme S subunit